MQQQPAAELAESQIVLLPHQGVPARLLTGTLRSHLHFPHRNARFTHSERYRVNRTGLSSPFKWPSVLRTLPARIEFS